MKHKHAEMIKAKADNMELVVCINNYGQWEFGDMNNLVDLDAFPAFLCLPQHKEACLHWLNGGDLQVKRQDSDEFLDWDRPSREWKISVSLMHGVSEFRIKPRKEKRWIGYCANRNQTFPHPQDSKELALGYAMTHYSYHEDEWQFIEIETEV